MALSAADQSRLRTWVSEIAAALLPPEAQREDRGADWRFTKSGGLSVCKRNAAWYQHAAGRGGYSPIPLIALLRQCSDAEAREWAVAWLASNAGNRRVRR